MGKLAQIFGSFLDLFLQSNCPLCQRSTQAELCQYCQRQLQRCQLPNPSQFWEGELPVLAWGAYGGILKRAIAVLKYENQPQLAQPLGSWLGEAWLKSPVAATPQKLIVVPIPLHPKKLQQRGYNQAELLARSFCDMTGLRLQLGLERVKTTEAQFSLSQSQREENLANAFGVSKNFRLPHPKTPVLLLDDIYTSGATARSARLALQHQGIRVYGMVAIATPKLTRPSTSG